MNKTGRDLPSGVIGGAIIISIGLVFLLDNLGVISISHLWQFWPLILVVGGLASLTSPAGRIKGAILILLGVLLELDTLGIAHFRWSSLWPLIIILAGIMIMWSTLESRRTGAAAGDPRTTLNEFALFGGIERRVTSLDFQGGNVTAMFGGIELDLRQAAISADQAELSVNAFCGGCELRVPDNWEIVSRGQGIFGGYVDSTRGYNYEIKPDNPVAPRKTLIVRGIAVFGGVEIKS
jgi:predicted membrane protein